MTLLGEYLLASGMNQGAFAELSGVDRAMISHYVTGDRKPGLDNALAIERASNGEVPASYWTTFKPRPRKRVRARFALPKVKIPLRSTSSE